MFQCVRIWIPLAFVTLVLPLVTSEAQQTAIKPTVSALFPKGGSVDSKFLNLQQLYTTGSTIRKEADCRMPNFGTGCSAISVIVAMRIRDYLIGQISGLEQSKTSLEAEVLKWNAALQESLQIDRIKNGGRESGLTRARRNILRHLMETVEQQKLLLKCRNAQLQAARAYIAACVKRPNTAGVSCETREAVDGDGNADFSDTHYNSCVDACIQQSCTEENRSVGICNGDGDWSLLGCEGSCLDDLACALNAEEEAEDLSQEPASSDFSSPFETAIEIGEIANTDLEETSRIQ